MKTQNLFIAIAVLIVSIIAVSNSEAQTSQKGVFVRQSVEGLVRVSAEIASTPTTLLDEKNTISARIFPVDGEEYIFVQNSFTQNKLTAWVQKSNAQEAHFLGVLDYGIGSDAAYLISDAVALKNKVRSNTYPQMRINTKPLILATN